jgi:hypothetical protein
MPIFAGKMLQKTPKVSYTRRSDLEPGLRDQGRSDRSKSRIRPCALCAGSGIARRDCDLAARGAIEGAEVPPLAVDLSHGR